MWQYRSETYCVMLFWTLLVAAGRFDKEVISRPNQSNPPLTEILHLKLRFSVRSSHDLSHHWKNFQLEEELAWVMDLHCELARVISLCVGLTLLSIALMDFLHHECSLAGSCGHFVARVVEISYFDFFHKSNIFPTQLSWCWHVFSPSRRLLARKS